MSLKAGRSLLNNTNEGKNFNTNEFNSQIRCKGRIIIENKKIFASLLTKFYRTNILLGSRSGKRHIPD